VEDFGAFLKAAGLGALALARGGVELEGVGDGALGLAGRAAA
jgi:hypothetical protein